MPFDHSRRFDEYQDFEDLHSQMRIYMKFRQIDTPTQAAAKAGFSPASGYRFEHDPRLASQRRRPRQRRRPDPLAAVWEREIVPMLQVAPGLRPIAILEEILRRHAEIDPGVRRTLERRIRHWRALNGPEREVIFRQASLPVWQRPSATTTLYSVESRC